MSSSAAFLNKIDTSQTEVKLAKNQRVNNSFIPTTLEGIIKGMRGCLILRIEHESNTNGVFKHYKSKSLAEPFS